MNNLMNDRQYFMTTSLSYQLKAAQQELASFRSGEIYVKLRADYEKIIREQNMTIQKLQKERDDFSFSRKKITQQWMEVLEDVEKEYEKNQKAETGQPQLRKFIPSLLKIHQQEKDYK